MYRSGSYQAGEAFSKEAKVAMGEEYKNKFKELNTIVMELKANRNVDTALKWAQNKAKELELISSDLLFNLHKSQICKMVSQLVELKVNLKKLKMENGMQSS